MRAYLKTISRNFTETRLWCRLTHHWQTIALKGSSRIFYCYQCGRIVKQ
jgi:hypothetical protein